jgi:hypothetical protein
MLARQLARVRLELIERQGRTTALKIVVCVERRACG